MRKGSPDIILRVTNGHNKKLRNDFSTCLLSCNYIAGQSGRETVEISLKGGECWDFILGGGGCVSDSSNKKQRFAQTKEKR